MKDCKIAIIGGGASGMAAALAALRAPVQGGGSKAERSVMVFERNRRTGEKIRISGGGKCNLTHAGPVDAILEEGFLRKGERRFLRHALHSFTGEDITAMMDAEGVGLEVRPDGKVFTAGGDANAVAEALSRRMQRAGTILMYASRVTRVNRRDGMFELDTEGGMFKAERLIIATGGASWPQLGTTGDGIRLGVWLGHKKTPLSPALAPVYLIDPPCDGLSGIALRSVTLYASSGKEKSSRNGDVLFTHRGLSGPAVLSLSRDVALIMQSTGSCSMMADLFPFHEEAALEDELLVHAARNGSQMVRKFLQSCPIAPTGRIAGGNHHNGTIPTAFVACILRHAGIGDDTVWGGLHKKARHSLLSVLKRFPLGSVSKVPMEQGEVSAGGVVLGEVNPKTMESRLVPGLYFAGEVLDYTGEIGGYNLQAAFSTGWLAGTSAAQSPQE
jgi:predicted Rossmann fold flavoprotein